MGDKSGIIIRHSGEGEREPSKAHKKLSDLKKSFENYLTSERECAIIARLF